MRTPRVRFEIVSDEEVIPIESLRQVDMSETVENFNSERESNLHIASEILGIPPREFGNAQYDLEAASTDFRQQFLDSLYGAQNQEEVEAILTRAESPTHPSLGGESFEVDFTQPYFDPNAFAVDAVRYSDLTLPEESPVPIRRNRRSNHAPEETLQQSINQELTSEELQMLEEAVIDAHREIPPNSGTLLVEESTSRFSSAIWFEAIKTKTVMLAGLGGIGSYTGFLLSRMQPANIILFDDDTVETVNLSGQLYSIQDVGNRKTNSLAEMMRNYGSYFSTSTYNKYTRDSATTDIMICGFDNMEARKIYFNNWLARVNSKTTIEEKKKCLYLDGRLSAEFLQIFCLRGDDEYFKEQYATKHFFTDSQADETICSYKQTTFMANMIGSLIVNLFVNFVANECEPLIERDVPFLTEYSAETMFLNTVH